MVEQANMASAAGRDEERAFIKSSNRADLIVAGAGLIVTVVVMSMLLALVVDLALTGLGRIDGQFFLNFPSRHAEEAGILSAWVGTTLVMLVTAAIAVPLGVASGIYLEEYAGKNLINNLIEINVTNLAGVPSIIYGLLALGLFVYTFGMGQTVLVAGLVLALLILPVVIVATREAVRSVPYGLREAAFALGADQWQVVWMHILPAARPGILTGVIVGLSRAIGETAPVITIGALTFIAFLPPPPVEGEFPFLSFEWLNSPFTVMPIQMFNWVSRPQAEFHVNAAATGLVLLAMTLAMNGFAIWIRYRLRRGER